jgi:hypothetical protein
MASLSTLKKYLTPVIQSIQKNVGNLSSSVKRNLTSVFSEIGDLFNQQDRTNVPQIEEPNESTRLLWTLSNGDPNAFIEYLKTFPDPSLQSLLQNQDLLGRTLLYLRTNYPPPQVSPDDVLERPETQSSNVYGFKYNPQDASLIVRFHNGSVYNYANVPEYVFNLFRSGAASATSTGRNKYGSWWRGKNPSTGAALNQFIKNLGYPYQRIR